MSNSATSPTNGTLAPQSKLSTNTVGETHPTDSVTETSAAEAVDAPNATPADDGDKAVAPISEVGAPPQTDAVSAASSVAADSLEVEDQPTNVEAGNGPVHHGDVSEVAIIASGVLGKAKLTEEHLTAGLKSAAQVTAAKPSVWPTGDVRSKIAEFINAQGVLVCFDGSLVRPVSTTDGLETVIKATVLTPQSLEDEFTLSDEASTFKSSVIKRGMRRVLAQMQRERLASLALPLFERLSAKEARQAEASWSLLATVFEQEEQLTVAKLRHFLWQVKRKISMLTVTRHMMLIVVGAKQGTGKTQFVDRLVAPWEEAATGPVLISDIVDARSADIFRFPIAKIDDMEHVPRDKIGVLKSVITGVNLRRRMLGSMGSVGFAQAVTLVGTANHDIQELVDDDSGHRRFASLTMRGFDGPPDANPHWDIINRTDYQLLWRSVDVFDEPPIEAFLDELEDEQNAGALQTSLKAWLLRFDPEDEEVKAIETAAGFGATALFDLFVSQTGSLMSQTEFGNRMRRYVGRPGMPFGMKRKTSESNVYPLTSDNKRAKKSGN